MEPLDAKNLTRLIATLEDVERAVDVSRVHIGAGCPDAAAQELGSAKISIAHALRIAHGPARDYVPDHADDDERHHADIAAGRTCDWMREEERDLYDY